MGQKPQDGLRRAGHQAPKPMVGGLEKRSQPFQGAHVKPAAGQVGQDGLAVGFFKLKIRAPPLGRIVPLQLFQRAGIHVTCNLSF